MTSEEHDRILKLAKTIPGLAHKVLCDGSVDIQGRIVLHACPPVQLNEVDTYIIDIVDKTVDNPLANMPRHVNRIVIITFMDSKFQSIKQLPLPFYVGEQLLIRGNMVDVLSCVSTFPAMVKNVFLQEWTNAILDCKSLYQKMQNTNVECLYIGGCNMLNCLNLFRIESLQTLTISMSGSAHIFVKEVGMTSDDYIFASMERLLEIFDAKYVTI